MFTGALPPSSVSVIGDPELGPLGPFAFILRPPTEANFSSDGERIDLNGVDARLRTTPDGNGQVHWTLPDGSDGYIRSRGLEASQLAVVAQALAPTDNEDGLPGFGFEPDEPIPGLEFLHEQLNTELDGAAWRADCVIDSQSWPRLFAFLGDPVWEFWLVIDRPVPTEVSRVGDYLVLYDGPDTLRVDDLVQPAD